MVQSTRISEDQIDRLIEAIDQSTTETGFTYFYRVNGATVRATYIPPGADLTTEVAERQYQKTGSPAVWTLQTTSNQPAGDVLAQGMTSTVFFMILPGAFPPINEVMNGKE